MIFLYPERVDNCFYQRPYPQYHSTIFLQYLKSEYQMTTNPVFILLFLEMIIIICYTYLPNLIDKINITGGTPLLPKAVFLDKEMSIGKNDVFIMPQSDPNNLLDKSHGQPTVFRLNYAFSMWIYLNPQPINTSSYTKETNIFNFGDGKPRVAYINRTQETDHNKDLVVVYLSNENPTSSRFKIKLDKQKWNHLVFNYSDNGADLFVNGSLSRSITFTEQNTPNYQLSDSITVGSNDGLYGSICNITYYKSPLTTFQVANLYNLLMFRNPPTNGM
jgi:hypothetical protein